MIKTLETVYTLVSESKTVYKTKQEGERMKITRADEIPPIIRQFIQEDIELKEFFYIVLLNRANKIIAVQKISEGSQTGTVVDIRVIVKCACDLLATGVILCHNHPSGNLKPSNEDITITRKIKQVLDLLDIRLLDHIILAPNYTHYSFSEEGDI